MTFFKDAYAKIKERLSRKPEGESAVEKFEQNPTKGASVFQTALAEQLTDDTELLRMLAEALEKSANAEPGSLVGKI